MYSFVLTNEISCESISRATELPNAGEIQELIDTPGKGHLITFTDPDGFPVNLMYGAKSVAERSSPEKLIYNYESEKPRVRKFQRFTPGPAAVYKVRLTYPSQLTRQVTNHNHSWDILEYARSNSQAW